MSGGLVLRVFETLVLLSLLVSVTLAFTPVNSTNPVVPAVIVFGDSIVDPGNNNVVNTIIKCNFPPYGIDFVGQKPTGRFCNGRIPTDFIASKLGVKQLLPAYLDSNLDSRDLFTGVSFASGGAGYDPLTSKIANVISMSEQLELFKEYQEKLRGIGGETRAASIISDSLYVVCVGSDDIANTYFPTPFRKAEYDIPAYATLLVRYASSFYEDLISLGAKKIGVVGVPPIGCVPSQRTLGGGVLRNCASSHNQLARLFNSKLNNELQRLRVKHRGATLVFVNAYGILLDIMLHPKKYGFEISTKGCCGTGDLEVSILCNGFTSKTCGEVLKYVFWDSYHPTERAYEILVDKIIEGYIPLLI